MLRPHESLRSLRARSGLSMRAFAATLGAPLDKRYAYYEEKRFTGPLPIDAARQIAAALQPFGVDSAEIFALAGLSPDESETEASTEPDVQQVLLPVALPNVAALTRMFETLLEDDAPEEGRAELARRLASRLPAALQRAASSTPVRARLPRGGDAAPPARHRPPLLPE
jgi:transcriptional regulator with XRE-family HTH domain